MVPGASSRSSSLFFVASRQPSRSVASRTILSLLPLRRCRRLGARARRGRGRPRGSGRTCRKDRANPRTTGRWTTWRHVVGDRNSGVAGRRGARRTGRRRNGRTDELERKEIERRSRFLGTRRSEHGPYKAFPLVRYSESASIVLVLSPVAFGRVKKTCFCARAYRT